MINQMLAAAVRQEHQSNSAYTVHPCLNYARIKTNC